MGLNFRLMKLNPNFQHLNKNSLIQAYKQSSKRLIFLDYEVNKIFYFLTFFILGNFNI